MFPSRFVVIVLFATFADADDGIEIGMFAKIHEAYLHKYLGLENGVPSHDTIQRAMDMLSPGEKRRGNAIREKSDFTESAILEPLMRFALPVMFALFLQAMYEAVDLFVVGKFAAPEDVSAVSTGSQITLTLGNLISSLAMGTTVTVQRIAKSPQLQSKDTVTVEA